MKFINARYMAKLALKLSYLPGQLLKKEDANIVHDKVNWDEEKEDILERADWLCKNIILEPDQLLKKMPFF